MGLDGISVNQLRITPENNSSELNRVPKFSLDNSRPVDGLSQGQKVDPDKEREKEKRELNKQYNSLESSDENVVENDSNPDDDIIKYDLSQSDKYVLDVDEDSDEILIIEKITKKVIQRIDADSLSSFIKFLSFSQGGIINRKF